MFSKIFVIFCFSFWVRESFSQLDVCNGSNNVDLLSRDEFIQYLTDPCRYNKNVAPNSNISVSMVVTHAESSQSTFTLYAQMQIVYLLKALNYEHSDRSEITGDESLSSKIWTPNILLQDTSDINVLQMSQKNIAVTIAPNGLVSFSYKMVVSFNCWLHLQKFPFDHQKCSLEFTNTGSLLKWAPKSPTFSNNIHFTEYDIDAFSIDTVGSDIQLELFFHRNIGYYLLDFFLPSYLLVATAWVTFWLQADAGPPRATLGASTNVAFITLHLGVTKDIPKVSYVKASDIWFLVVSLFLFLSLAEFAFVNVIWRRRKQVELKKLKHKYIIKSAVMPRKAREDLKKLETNQPLAVISQSNDNKERNEGNYTMVDLYQDEANAQNHDHVFNWTIMTPQEVAIYVDRKARIVFPIAFAIFNVIYWFFVIYF